MLVKTNLKAIPLYIFSVGFKCWFWLGCYTAISVLVSLYAGSHRNQRSIHSFFHSYPYKTSSFYYWCHHHCSSWKRAYMDYELSLAFSRYRVLHENWRLLPLFHLTSYFALGILTIFVRCCHVPFSEVASRWPLIHQPGFDQCFADCCPTVFTHCSKID